MENKAEDELRKKWEIEAKEKAEREQETMERPTKRPRRAIGYLESPENSTDHRELGALLDNVAGKNRGAAKTKKGDPRRLRSVGGRPKSKITVTEGEGTIVELD